MVRFAEFSVGVHRLQLPAHRGLVIAQFRGPLLLGQPRFAQPVEEMLVVLFGSKCDYPSRRARNCIAGLQSQDLSRPGSRLSELAQLRIGRTQQHVTVPKSRCPGSKVAQGQ